MYLKVFYCDSQSLSHASNITQSMLFLKETLQNFLINFCQDKYYSAFC